MNVFYAGIPNPVGIDSTGRSRQQSGVVLGVVLSPKTIGGGKYEVTPD
jgi:hypothetical protein